MHAAEIFDIHPSQQNKHCNRKSENFENITFLPIIYKSMTKNRKFLANPKKYERKKNGNSNTSY